MKKLICVFLLFALCASFAGAEESRFPFVELPFDEGIDVFLPGLIDLYGGEPSMNITQLNTVKPWNNLTKAHMGRSLPYTPENMEVCGYKVRSIDLVELVRESDTSVRKMAYITMYFDVAPGKEAEAYEILCERVSEVYGSGLGNSQDSKWVSNTMKEWFIDETRFLAADLWQSKRDGSCRLKLHYGEKDFQLLWKNLNN